MKELTLKEFRAQLKAQGVAREDCAFICPMCGTIQSANTLIKAGAGKNFDDVQKYLGFSCVGRFINKGSLTDENGKNHGCNCTLDDLFKCHALEIITQRGDRLQCFDLASPEEAQKYAQDNKGNYHD